MRKVRSSPADLALLSHRKIVRSDTLMVVDNFESCARVTDDHTSIKIDSHDDEVDVRSYTLPYSRHRLSAGMSRVLAVNETASCRVPSRTVVLNVLESLLTEVDNVIFKDAPFGFEKVFNVFCSEEECGENDRNILCVMCARLFVSFVVRSAIHAIAHLFVLCDADHIATSMQALVHLTSQT
jgi:hypothetical protein